MSIIHFIGGEKGGVGKSLVARVLAQYLIDHKLPFLGFDSDRSHGALLRFYAGFASPVVIDDYDSLDKVVEAAAENPSAASSSTSPRRPTSRWSTGSRNRARWNWRRKSASASATGM